VHTPEWLWIESCCTSAPKLTSCARWHRLSSARHSKGTATPAKNWKFNDGLQAATFFWGGAQRPTQSSSSQRVSAWHACMDRTTPSLCSWSPHRQQPLGKGAHAHALSLFLMHMQHTHAHKFHSCASLLSHRSSFSRAGPASPANCAAALAVALPGVWSSCCCSCCCCYLLSARCCCCLLLPVAAALKESDPPSLPSDDPCTLRLMLGRCVFQASRGLDGLSSCLLSLYCSLQRMRSASDSVTSTTNALPAPRLPFGLLVFHCLEDGIAHHFILPSKS